MEMCKIPDGLHELCADISMEVLRIQPDDMYSFIANYLDVLLITRENAKFAVNIVREIVLNSEQIVQVLSSSGLKLKEIAAAAPRLQEAFRTYLDIVEISKKECGCDADDEVNENEISICRILQETGATSEQARVAGKNIQAIFQRHYEQVLLAEERGEIQWERADMKTKHILLKMGITEEIATRAALTIQTAYREYYARKNRPPFKDQQNKTNYGASKEPTDISSWLDMMFEHVGLTFTKANSAATIIQKAYRRYRNKKHTNTYKTNLNGTEAINKDEEGQNIKNIEESIEPLTENKNDLQINEAIGNIKEAEEVKMEKEKGDGKSEADVMVEKPTDPKIKIEEDDTQTSTAQQIDIPIEPKAEDEHKNIKNEADKGVDESVEERAQNEASDEKIEITPIGNEPVLPKTENEANDEEIKIEPVVDEELAKPTTENEAKATETTPIVDELVEPKTENVE